MGKTDKIPSLDGIRAVSFAVVFVSHCGPRGIGGFGVSVFFFLSGFLITTLLRKEWVETGTFSLRRFYLRRVLRIFPPMYLTVTFIMAAQMLLRQPVLWHEVAGAGAFALNYIVIFDHTLPAGMHALDPFWSLAVEEHFYLVFPLLLILTRRWSDRRKAVLLAAICAVVLFWRLMLYPSPSHILFSTDTRIDTILFGCITALLFDLDSVNAISETKRWRLLAGGGALLLLGAIPWSPFYRQTLRYSVEGIAFVPLFLAAIRFHDRWPFRFLNLPPVTFVGRISYTLYLCHLFFLLLFREILPRRPEASILLGAAATFLFACLMYYAVEEPLSTLRRRLAQAPQRSQLDRDGFERQLLAGKKHPAATGFEIARPAVGDSRTGRFIEPIRSQHGKGV